MVDDIFLLDGRFAIRNQVELAQLSSTRADLYLADWRGDRISDHLDPQPATSEEMG